MPFLRSIPLLLSLLIGLLIAMVSWGFWRNRTQGFDSFLPGARDDVLLGLVVLAVFALGVFLVYALLVLNF